MSNFMGAGAVCLDDIIPANAGAHNAIYRGKYLGSAVTDAQYAAIKAGTFEEMYIGDYWTIGGMNYRIAAIDYYLGAGDTRLTKHHLVIVPDTYLYDAVMNNTNTTSGGYVGSLLRQSLLSQARNTISAAFGSHILTKREWLTNSVSKSSVTNGGWYDSDIEIMNEVQAYGSIVWGSRDQSDWGGTGGNGRNVGISNAQFPLFAFDHTKLNLQSGFWLRDVVFADGFAAVDYAGNAWYQWASNEMGVRPYFCIG